MDYTKLDRLLRNDPLVFHMGVEVLMQTGRNLVLESSEYALVNELMPKLGGLIAEEKLYEVARATRQLAELDTKAFLHYLQSRRIHPGPFEKEDAVKDTLSPAQADGRAINIDLGYAVLETSVMLPTPDMPVEVTVNLVFPDGEHQDIAMVRPSESEKGCEVLVWIDPQDEGYTNRFEIPVRSGEDEPV